MHRDIYLSCLADVAEHVAHRGTSISGYVATEMPFISGQMCVRVDILTDFGAFFWF